jgi:hypothetical protein
MDRISCELGPALSFFKGYRSKLPVGCFLCAESAELTLDATADDNEAELWRNHLLIPTHFSFKRMAVHASRCRFHPGQQQL